VWAILGALILGAPLASSSKPAKPASISGEISADNDVFIPIKQEGNVVTLLHPDVHELTGAVEGKLLEVGRLTLDLSTGKGFFSTEAQFAGTVLGGAFGTATIKLHGKVRDSGITENGYFVIFGGRDGLAGIHATGTYDYVLGKGGTYRGQLEVDERR
jgi:hypothetical protein